MHKHPVKKPREAVFIIDRGRVPMEITLTRKVRKKLRDLKITLPENHIIHELR